MTLTETTTADAERAVLGAMFNSRDVVWTVLETLLPADFEDPRHEVIARTVVGLANAGSPCDVIAVGDALDRQGLKGQAGGGAYLFEIDTGIPIDARYYGEIIRDRATLRRLRQAGQSIYEMASGQGEAAELAERARDLVDTAAARGAAPVHAVGETIGRALDGIGATAAYVPTPWAEINGYVNGFSAGRLYVIGARPASGKTIIALQSAVRLAAEGAVSFSSLEMDEGELQTRLLASQASVDLTAMSRNTLTPTDWTRLANARAAVADLPLFIDDRADVFVTQIAAQARTVSRRRRLAGVVVDYVGIVKTPDDRRARHEHVGQITRALKVLAKQLRVPVLLVAQLNRESEGVPGKGQRLPTLRDLRESGSLEQDADVVLLLQRRKDKDDRDTEQLDVVIAKNRHGRTGRVVLHWEGQYARIVSPAWSSDPQLPIEELRRDLT